MKQGILVNGRVKILMRKRTTLYRPRRTGERKRKSARADLKSENLRLKLDLGIKHDRDTTSVDESLRSVDEEVQEVTAVRMGKLCRRCLGINDA